MVSPRAGRDHKNRCQWAQYNISIHSLRAGRDLRDSGCEDLIIEISIHSPRARRDGAKIHLIGHVLISIHSPRAGRDHVAGGCKFLTDISIHSPRAGRDFGPLCGGAGMSRISIHSPRAGRDTAACTAFPRLLYFNPLAPCGARRKRVGFYSYETNISIHSPRAGRDRSTFRLVFQLLYFNPLAPCGARHCSLFPQPSYSSFQSTRPVRGETSPTAVL